MMGETGCTVWTFEQGGCVCDWIPYRWLIISYLFEYWQFIPVVWRSLWFESEVVFFFLLVANTFLAGVTSNRLKNTGVKFLFLKRILRLYIFCGYLLSGAENCAIARIALRIRIFVVSGNFKIQFFFLDDALVESTLNNSYLKGIWPYSSHSGIEYNFRWPKVYILSLGAEIS